MNKDELPPLPPIEKLVEALDKRDPDSQEPTRMPIRKEIIIRTEICPILRRYKRECKEQGERMHAREVESHGGRYLERRDSKGKDKEDCEIRILQSGIVCECFKEGYTGGSDHWCYATVETCQYAKLIGRGGPRKT